MIRTPIEKLLLESGLIYKVGNEYYTGFNGDSEVTNIVEELGESIQDYADEEVWHATIGSE